MADAIVKKSSSPAECCNCHKQVGEKAKVFPVRASAADAPDVGSAVETWCPNCFVYHRAPLEPGRWHNVFCVQCGNCGTQSLLYGHRATCPACASNALVVLPPAPVIARA